MFDDHTYAAPAYEPAPCYAAPLDYGMPQPWELPNYEAPADDPMAYALPAVVDAYAFDPSAPNAAVGYAMNEVARILAGVSTLSNAEQFRLLSDDLCRDDD